MEMLRECGVAPDKRVTWALGAAMRQAWRETSQCLPQKALRAKTSGLGSHCLAVYPRAFRERGLRVLERFIQGERRQSRLPFDGGA